MLNPQAIKAVQQYLAQFAATDEFESSITSIFGTKIGAAAIRQQWLNRDFSLIPEIRILSNGELGRANGAYAASLDEILISSDFLAQHQDDLEAVVGVLLEEVGHKIDRVLNGNIDSPGDEGAIFRKLVTGESLSPELLAGLKAEDDRTVITVGGKSVEVEQQFIEGGFVNDVLVGTSENDYFYPYTGADTIDGGAGNDFLKIDDYYGDTNNITITYTTLTNGTITGGSNNGTKFQNIDQVYLVTGSGNDIINVSAATKIAEKIIIYEGFIGYYRNVNYIDTGKGDDSIIGGSTSDYILAGIGSDIINGGGGEDILKGGEGNDTYVINPTNAGSSIIEDTSGIDTLQITGVVEKLINKDEMGFGRNGTSLIIDLNKDGIVTSGFGQDSTRTFLEDLTIKNFFASQSGAEKGAGFIETIGNLTGDKVLKLFSKIINGDDFTITEGNSGTKNATFTVTRTGTATNTITVNYSTADGTATAGSDYTATSGTLTFATNETTKTITVPIISDTTFESDETFFVNLTNPSNATITDAQGIGTITNDDNVPTVSVSDAYVSVNENQNTVIKFKVTLSNPSDQDVTIVYSTSDKSPNSTGQGDAKDYQSITNETLTFAPGETSKEIAVTVFGERGVSDRDLEIFAKDTAYRNWEEGKDVDQIPNINVGRIPNIKPYAYDDLGYYVDQFFDDPKSDFQAVGLTSNENFSLKLTSVNNATIADGDAIGTIYDLGKAPILASRGTASPQDIFSDANPLGVGFDQYSANKNAVETWLKKVSQPENGGVIFRPNLTGHSLGGALTQLIAYNYTGNLGKVVTFNSPGITSSGAPKAGITSTTHYITSSDIVSMAGSNYLPGSYVLSDYSSGGLSGVADTHLLPMLSSKVGYDSTDLKKWQKKPTPLSQIPNLSSSNLSNFFFTYLPDPDYFAFQVAVSHINPVFAGALTFRGTTEASRIDLGVLFYVSKLLADTSVVGTSVTITKAALNAASKFSSDVWKKIIQSARNSLNQPSNNTQLQAASSRPVNAFALSINDLSSVIPSDVSSDISINVSSDIPNDVSPWDSFSKWTVGIWEASPNWDIQTFTNAIANINTPPGVENPILDQVATENKPFSLTFAETTFVEIDSNDSLIYSATLADGSSLPTWLSFNPTTRSFLGTPTKENIGSINIKVTATDKTGATVSDVFTLAVNIPDNDAEIRGLQWNDVNGNGVIDTTETGLKDWKIYLDTNTNGQLDTGELSTTTDTDGNYSFTNLRPGTYTVAEEIQPGWKQTYPGVSITTTASDIQLINPSSPIITSDTFSTTSATSLVNLDEFWADSRFTNIKGKGFSTVIIDTGANLNSPYFGADANNDGIADKIVYQYDFADNDTDASDKNNHGSHIASIASAVAPESNLIILKVFKDSGTGSFSDLEKALQWVNSNTSAYNIASVNLSLGDGQDWTTPLSRYGIGDELAAIASQNVLISAAAGNGFYTYNSQVGLAYPAIDPSVISVGAVWADNFGSRTFSNGAIDNTTAADRIASFSQRSTLLDVFAPGILITGANATGGSITMGGTSQATPYVSAIATLAQQIAQTNLGRKLTLAEFSNLLATKSDLITDGDDENDNVTNTGAKYPRINVVSLAEGILSLSADGTISTPTSPTNNGTNDSLQIPNNNNLNLVHTVTLTSGQIAKDLNFGNQKLNQPSDNDFNGDGKSDILWRNTDGSIAIWQMNGSTVTKASAVETLTPDWQIAATGDFNGDAKADILWRNTDGSVATWQMNGAAVTKASSIGIATTDWKVAGTGDFNGDGKSDILWRNTDGSVATWQMDGATVKANSIEKVTADWLIAGIGDFNGDGKSDILWQNNDGSVVEWQMNGASVNKVNSIGTATTDWTIAGTSDFNGDGKADILLGNTNGSVALWQMNGSTVTSATSLAGSATADWKIIDTGINSLGQANILWRNDDGNVATWQLNGSTILSAGSNSIPTADTSWKIAAPIL